MQEKRNGAWNHFAARGGLLLPHPSLPRSPHTAMDQADCGKVECPGFYNSVVPTNPQLTQGWSLGGRQEVALR